MSTADVRSELGDVLHTDFRSRTLLCEGGDLVRDLEVEGFCRDGPGRWRAGPRSWASYARVGSGDRSERPVMTWEEAAEILGVSSSTIRRRRRDASDQTEPPWRSPAAVRAWWRNLVAPVKRNSRSRKRLSFDEMEARR